MKWGPWRVGIGVGWGPRVWGVGRRVKTEKFYGFPMLEKRGNFRMEEIRERAERVIKIRRR